MNDVTAPVEVPAISSPMELLSYAVANRVNLEELKLLMELERQWREDKAEREFTRAMTRFRAEVIEIPKRGHGEVVKDGRTIYTFAFPKLSDVLEITVPLLSKQGLSHSWSTDQSEGSIAVTCILRHRDGHAESVSLSAAPDETGGKNRVQAVGSTVSYLERYTFLAVTGLAASDQDNDGARPVLDLLTQQHIDTINRLLDESGADTEAFLGWFKVERVEDIPRMRFDEAVKGLKARIRKNKQDNDGQA